MPKAKYPKPERVVEVVQEKIESPKRRWLTTRRAADYIGTTFRGLQNFVSRGKIRAYKPFGRLLFDIDELDRLILASNY